MAATLGTHFDTGKPEARDTIDRASSRPDLLVLLYPVITMGEMTHGGSKLYLLDKDPSPELVKLYSNELQVTSDTPPIFIAHAVSDPAVPIENSLMFADALRKAKVPFELHLYEKGPHGYGLAPTNPVLASWTERCRDWLIGHGFAKKLKVRTD